MVKLKRKLAGLNEFNTFQSYIDYLNNRVEFTDANESIIQINKNCILVDDFCFTNNLNPVILSTLHLGV